MYSKELIEYVMKRTQFKAKQVVRKYPSLGEIDDVRSAMVVDVMERLPKFNGERAGVKTFISRIIDNKIASMLKSRLAARRGSARKGPSVDDWVLDEHGAWTQREALIGEDRLHAHRGVSQRSDQERRDMELDVATILARLTPEQRKLCEQLKKLTPSEIKRETTRARSLIYKQMAPIEKIFFEAKLHLYR